MLARRPLRCLPLARPPYRSLGPRRTLIAPPTPGSGPLMERRADRALPSINPPRRWLRTLPLFLAILTASHSCDIQLPEVLLLRRVVHALRAADLPEGEGGVRRRDLLPGKDTLDHGRDEPAARAD